MSKIGSKSHTSEDRKIHPKLRLFANGDTTVNVLRAEQCGTLAAKSKAVISNIPQLRGDEAMPLTKIPAKV